MQTAQLPRFWADQPNKRLGGVLHLAQTDASHLEYAQLGDSTKAVLGRANYAVGVSLLTFKTENGVHHVLEYLRPG